MEFYFEIPADIEIRGFKDLWPVLAEKFDVPIEYIRRSECWYDDDRCAYVGNVWIWQPELEFRLNAVWL